MTETVPTIKKFNSLRQTIETFPLKCKLFLNLLLSSLPQGSTIQIPKDFKKAYSSYLHTFDKMNTDEKLFFIGEISNNLDKTIRNGVETSINVVNSIETSCEVKSSFVGLNFWEKRNFKYHYQANRVQLVSSKKEDVLDLKNYLVRKSGSEKNAIVFEAISKAVNDKMSKITIKFSNSSIFQELYVNIRRDVIEISERKMSELFKEDAKDTSIDKVSQTNRSKQGFTILTSKNMTEYFARKQKMNEKIRKNRVKAVLVQNKNSTKIFRNSQNKKYYYLEQNIVKSQPLDEIKKNISILAEQSTPNKMIFQVLETFTQNITANYYKLDVGVKEYQFVVITERNQKDGFYQLTMKTATHFFLDISIEFVVATLRKINQDLYSFQLSVIFDFNSKKRSNLQNQIINLMISMSYGGQVNYRKSSIKNIPFFNDQLNYSVVDVEPNSQLDGYQLNQSMQFNLENDFEEEKLTTSSGKKQSSQEDPIQQKDEQQQYFFSIVGDEQNRQEDFYDCPDQVRQASHSKGAMHNSRIDIATDYLQMKPFDKPRNVTSLQVLTEHFLFGEWRRSTKGGVVCNNQEVIKEQKRVLKLVVTKIGSNIYKGSGVMNISLPVQIFKQESSLVSIARNFTYAPLLIEPFVTIDPLERLKKICVFQISMASLALSTKKPFNPILGETYQGQIGGCPVFLQQVSHHPPITSVYFVGRGYKIYGTMQLQVNLRLNYVRGVNNCLMTIQFDNGDKVEFQMPVMLINGMLIGQRSIYFEGTVYFTDRKNNLIAEMIYNVNNSKKGMFSFKSESPDYLTTEIYKVSPTFMENFIASDRKLPIKKDNKSKLVSKIHGQWNGKIFVDDKEAFDFEDTLPVVLENCSNPLPSDSILRTDVIQLKNGDLNIAQEEKDRLEELQRRDKKLRLASKQTKDQ